MGGACLPPAWKLNVKIVWMIGLCVFVYANTYRVCNASGDDDWASYGNNPQSSHYSLLSQINTATISRMGLAWWFDIPGVVLASSVPLEVDGRVYFTTGYSVVRALDAASGRLLWTYDTEVAKVAGHKLRLLWGVRGIAFWNGKIFVGTHDGRLIALDANTGRLVWSVSTTQPGDLRIITGPPLVFKGRVLIGHGVADYAPVRGYVTAYDAETGRQLWRFFTVPGDPSKGFEDKAMAMAAQTWSGQWWQGGGGATVWNAMTYDAAANRIYIGTGSGAPSMANARSPAGGDNLFVAAIVALDADTGAYIWHYQANPGETWDYDATNDIVLADVVIDGSARRVLLQASKNGFFYVIDRDTGRLISAEKFAQVTWAKSIDLRTGRPVETADAREHPPEQRLWPLPHGAHSYQAMAFDPTTNLAYVPVFDALNDTPAEHFDWKKVRAVVSGYLLAWNPVKQSAAWRITLPSAWNGGVVATGGNLVFQGRSDGHFVAYAAASGKQLWSFDAQAGIVGAPITYQVAHRQYVSVMAGVSGLAASLDSTWNARTQQRRLLTFALDSNAQLPLPLPRREIVPVDDPEFRHQPGVEGTAGAEFNEHCSFCHGVDAVAGGTAPDLRESVVILSSRSFLGIVKDGTLLEHGMPRFEEFTGTEVENIRQYLRSRAQDARSPRPTSH